MYSPSFAATSPYIRGTIRENPTFLWASLAVWLVRAPSPRARPLDCCC